MSVHPPVLPQVPVEVLLLLILKEHPPSLSIANGMIPYTVRQASGCGKTNLCHECD